jgi:hypothetical protein
MRTTLRTLITAALALPGLAAGADNTDGWQFRASLYGYFPDIGGTTQASTPAGDEFDIKSDDLIRNTKFAAMGSFEAQKGRWGAFTDLIYMNVGDSISDSPALGVGSLPLPPGITADASLDVEAWVWTLALDYRAMSTPRFTLDTFAGARLLDITTDLGIGFSAEFGPFVGPNRELSAHASGDNWDAIAGLKGRYTFGDRNQWYVPFYADIGTGESKLTTQLATGLGYSFSWGDLFANWRYVDYEMKSGAMLDELDFSGPALGVAVRF